MSRSSRIGRCSGRILEIPFRTQVGAAHAHEVILAVCARDFRLARRRCPCSHNGKIGAETGRVLRHCRCVPRCIVTIVLNLTHNRLNTPPVVRTAQHLDFLLGRTAGGAEEDDP